MIRIASLFAALTLVGCGADRENAADRPAPPGSASLAGEAQAAVPAPAAAAAPPAPPALQARIDELAAQAGGHVGVAVKDLEAGWIAAHRGDQAFPQQSSMKIWLGVALLDAMDRGELSLDEPVLIRTEDLSVFNQPLRHRVDADGYVATLRQLLTWSLAKSDNAATDILMRRLGEGAAVQAVLERKGIRGVNIGVQERMLQPAVSGLRWRPEFVDPQVFAAARKAVPFSVRSAAFDDYVRRPLDGATPMGTVNALEALKEGRLLSPFATNRLLTIMVEGRGGAARLKAGLTPDWVVAHKTGTGPDWQGETAGYNDVGVLTAPDGRLYAVAVYMGRTGIPIRARQAFMADVARAVAEHWAAEAGADAAAVATEHGRRLEGG